MIIYGVGISDNHCTIVSAFGKGGAGAIVEICATAIDDSLFSRDMQLVRGLPIANS